MLPAEHCSPALSGVFLREPFRDAYRIVLIAHLNNLKIKTACLR